MQYSQKARLVALMVALAAVIAIACGGGSSKSVSVVSTVTPSITPQPSSASSPTPVPTLHDASDEISGFRSVFFVDDQTGWVGGFLEGEQGGAILKTSDGGSTWTRQYSGPKVVSWLHFASPLVGWALADPHRGDWGKDPLVLLHTTDSGEHWQPIDERLAFGGIHFFTLTLGRALGDADGAPHLLETTDAGRTWKVIPTTIVPWSMCFSDIQHGFATAQDGQVYRTLDGGRTWQYSLSVSPEIRGGPTGASLKATSVQCVQGTDTAWASFFGGAAAFQAGTALFRTSDGGASWTPTMANDYPDLRTTNWPGGFVSIIDENIAYVVATGGAAQGVGATAIRKTVDAGATWSAAVGLTELNQASDVLFSDMSHGWAVGTHIDAVQPFARYPVILATSDGGQTWTQQYP